MKPVPLKAILALLIFALAALDTRAQNSWTNIYGPAEIASTSDQTYPGVIVVDGSGNVIVTGNTPDAAISVTVKYSNAGLPLWTNEYLGLGRGFDGFAALAVDKSGNVFVAAGTGASSGDDLALIKYSSAGAPLWTNVFGAEIESSQGACALAIDDSGNVVAAGTAANGQGSDYATIKYSNAGTALWTNLFTPDVSSWSGAQAVAVDSNGNAFVTGAANGQFATIAYSGAGSPLWTNNCGGLLASTNLGAGFAIAVDGSGNVLVTGRDDSDNYETVKYSNAGVLLWTNLYDAYSAPSAMAVDRNGNVLVTGLDSNNYSGHPGGVTIKYSSTGVPLWTNIFNGTATGINQANSVAVDSEGNVYVAGIAYVSSPGIPPADFVTIKYSSTGMPLSTNIYNGSGNEGDVDSALALDSNGDLFVAGTSFSGEFDGPINIVTIKYAGVAAFPVSILTSDGNFGVSNGVFGFNVSGPVGASVIIQGSSDLSTWTPLQTNVMGGGPSYFSDPQPPGFSQRYYRAVTLPP